MADVRAMLRQERAARQQNARPTRQSAAPSAAPVSKKRKATDDEFEERKRNRTEEEHNLPAGFFQENAPTDESAQPASLLTHTDSQAQSKVVDEAAASAPDEGAVSVHPSKTPPPPPAAQTIGAITEDELEALFGEPTNSLQDTRSGPGATISAAPITAAELAAQAREEQSAQRGRREEELEAEKEDAARFLEEEFDQMDELEQRAKKLRERREALRQTGEQQATTNVVDLDPEPVKTTVEEESDDDDEDWDDWNFRAT